MSITIFGAAVFLIGTILLLSSSVSAMLIFVEMTSLLGGAAGIAIGGTSGSSIPPANLALLFLALRAVLPGAGQMTALSRSIEQNRFVIVFALYGVVTALIMPRLFAGVLEVTPMHPGAIRGTLEAEPLRFSVQNITASFYLIGTLIASVGAFIGASKRGAGSAFVTAAIWVALIHAYFGVSGVLLEGTPYKAVIDFFRNGHYAQLDQTLDGYSRMTGIWPEASNFATYGIAWFIFMVELWIRDVKPRGTGLGALALGFALTISTSSTAYVGLFGYSAVLVLRSVLLPSSTPLRKALAAGAVLFAASTMVLLLAASDPKVAGSLGNILKKITIDKAGSNSGLQRAFWARQGLYAFAASWGLGIGPGSFRSSSIITAILGSTGVIGFVTFVLHMGKTLKPMRASTYFGASNNDLAIGVAAGWTAVLMLIPVAVSAPSPDPGLVWAMFSGVAIALRMRTVPVLLLQPPSPVTVSPPAAALEAPLAKPSRRRRNMVMLDAEETSDNPVFQARARMSKLLVIIPTIGRAPLLARTIAHLALQDRAPDGVIVIASEEKDVEGLKAPEGMSLEILFSEKGSSRQRNGGIRHIGDDSDITAFFDDDFLPAHDYLAQLERILQENPVIMGATGRLIADGIHGDQISFEEGEAMIANDNLLVEQPSRPMRALYGCNMGFRHAALKGIWFDEDLPLYGWQEDIDFSFRVGRIGRLIKSDRLAGVHLGYRSGRTSGRRFGYSQIANPIYLLRKQTIPRKLAYKLMVRNFTANVVKSLRPEPHVDRSGRLRGNLIALLDLVRGSLHPTRVLKL